MGELYRVINCAAPDFYYDLQGVYVYIIWIIMDYA